MHRNRYTPFFVLLLGALLWAMPQQVSGQNRLVGERVEQSQLQLQYGQAKRAHMLKPSAATEQAFEQAQEALAYFRKAHASPQGPARALGMVSYTR